MKAKRIAEIAHEMAQLSKETMRRFKCWAKYGSPLSDEQLRAGDWYCTEVSAGVTQLLIDKEISNCIFSGPDGARAVKFVVPLNSEPSKEIIRKGNEFYYA